MKNKIKLFVIIVILYLILFGDIKLVFTTNNVKYDVKYCGIVWVGLDKHSIKKHQSEDSPIKWFYYEKTKK